MDRRSVLALGAAAVTALRSPAHAADPLPSSDRLPDDPSETIRLWPRTPPGGDGVHLSLQLVDRGPIPGYPHDRFAVAIAEPLLTVFRPERPDGSALLVVPGGGYRRVVVDKEGFESARRCAQAGITCFVLRYRLPAEGWADAPDVPLQDAQRATRLIRARATELTLDPKRVGVLGFSAGGHLAASLLTRPDEPVYRAVDAADALEARPDFAALLYPVISMLAPIAHGGSRDSLLGPQPSEAQEIAYSPQRHVTSNAPPTFIALAADDNVVDPQNGLAMFAALRAAGVASELHVFEEGGHGFGIAGAQGKPAAAWPDLMLHWGARHNWFRNVPI